MDVLADAKLQTSRNTYWASPCLHPLTPKDNNNNQNDDNDEEDDGKLSEDIKIYFQCTTISLLSLH